MATDCAAGAANHETFPPAAKVLESMTAHWGGLTVFVACPWVDIDNNQAERSMRAPVVGRKNFNGSGCEASADLAATMYSVFAKMKLWGLNLRTWLTTYLQACADNGNAPPADIDIFLPWQMDAKRLALKLPPFRGHFLTERKSPICPDQNHPTRQPFALK